MLVNFVDPGKHCSWGKGSGQYIPEQEFCVTGVWLMLPRSSRFSRSQKHNIGVISPSWYIWMWMLSSSQYGGKGNARDKEEKKQGGYTHHVNIHRLVSEPNKNVLINVVEAASMNRGISVMETICWLVLHTYLHHSRCISYCVTHSEGLSSWRVSSRSFL